MVRKPPTLLGYALLGLIAQQGRSGYALQQVFKTSPMGHYSGSPGAIYPALRGLERQGWVTAATRGQGSLRPSKEYCINQAGRNVLKEWLCQPVTRDDVVWNMDELMLRFAFMDMLKSCGDTIRFLKAFRAEVVAYVKELQSLLRSHGGSMPLHGSLALLGGIEGYKTQARWALTAIKRFQEMEKKT